MRWDLIDRFEVLQKGRLSRAVKSFSGKEDFFSEHFPGIPSVPESLFIEMIAQAGGVLFGLGLRFEKEVILAKIEEARFSKICVPPCSFAIEAVMEDEREEGAWVRGLVRENGAAVAGARILLVAVDELVNEKQGKIVFTDQFLKQYRVLEVAKASEAL
jgi:3-hydroxyacyl-[acyl-carrier-protein] dehydratase